MVLAILQAGAMPTTDAQADWLAEHGPLRIGLADIPPAAMFDRSPPRGWAVEVVQLAALKGGFDYELIPANSASVLETGLQNGTFDLIGMMAARPAVAQIAQMSTLAWVPLQFVTSDAHPDYATVNDIDGPVVTIAGSIMEKTLSTRFPEMEIVVVENTTQLITALETGQVNAIFAPLPAVGHEVQQRRMDGFRQFGEPLLVTEVGLWGLLEQPMPLSIFETGRARITDFELQTIHVKWTGFDLGPPAAPAPAVLPAWVAWTGWSLMGTLVFTTAVAAISRDQVRRRTSQLEQLNATLEHRIAQRTSSLEQRNADLAAFARAASHDLRSPIRSMKLQAQLSLREENLDDGVRDRLEQVVRLGGEASDLVDALLRLSQATTAPLRLARVDLAQVADRAVAAAGAEATRATIVLDIGPDVCVDGDEALLMLAVRNLLGNACKFTSSRPDGRIELRAGRVDDFVFMEVIDNGPGFDPAAAQRIFAPFERLPETSNTPGFGIGLATVQRVVERHGGTAHADAEPGLGARFRLTLPARSPLEATLTQVATA